MDNVALFCTFFDYFTRTYPLFWFWKIFIHKNFTNKVFVNSQKGGSYPPKNAGFLVVIPLNAWFCVLLLFIFGKTIHNLQFYTVDNPVFIHICPILTGISTKTAVFCVFIFVVYPHDSLEKQGVGEIKIYKYKKRLFFDSLALCGFCIKKHASFFMKRNVFLRLCFLRENRCFLGDFLPFSLQSNR